MKKNKVTTAVIPVAGLGTRFLPATKAQPKEMLAVVDKPVIQYIVEEAVAAGIQSIIFVTSHTKRAIEDHFGRNFELEYRLEQNQKDKERAEVARVGKLAKFAYVRQAKPLGDGDAILAALPFLDPDQPFAVLFGDDIIDAQKPGIGQLIEAHQKLKGTVIAVEQVSKIEVSRYGIVAGKKLPGKIIKISTLIEKPKPEDAPSTLGIIGRYIITPEIAGLLAPLKQKLKKGQELRLADAFALGLKKKNNIYAKIITGKRYDCGNKLGFLEASISLGLKHPEIRGSLIKYLQKIC